jgi:hypothetical protein
MSSFLDVALRNAARGFRVIPLSGKGAFLKGWPDLATTDETMIREWAELYPEFNVGVAGGDDFVVLDTDRESRLLELTGNPEWFETMKVSSGRPERAHFYYRTTPEVAEFGSPSWAESKDTDNIFELKGCGKLATAEGSTHPDTGAAYDIVNDLPIIPFPSGLLARLRELKGTTRSTVKATEPGDYTIEELIDLIDRSNVIARSEPDNIGDDWTIEIVCPWEDEHGSKRSSRDTTVGVINGRPTFSCLHGHCGDRHWKEFEAKVAPTPIAFISSTKAVEPLKDWRTLFHTFDETATAPEPTFLIDRFLQVQSITGIVGPARGRKSIVSLNVMHSLLTGEPLFGHFAVHNKPERVVYLCPEGGLLSVAKRIRKMGLLPFVGKTLFYRTMNADPIELDDPSLQPALSGAVVVIDTMVRFFEGDENNSGDMRMFGDKCMSLIRDANVRAVILIHHASKASNGDGAKMTLENTGRGSGDFGAFLTCAWGSTIQDMDAAHTANSLIKCLKQRDFNPESVTFECTPSGHEDDFFLKYAVGTENIVRIGAKAKPEKAQALELIEANMLMTAEELRALLLKQEPKIDYSEASIRTMKRRIAER